MRSLVTGGAGFIGSNLVRSLLASGESVRVLDDFSTGSLRNLEDLPGELDVVEGDVRDEAALDRAMAAVDVVYHLAALPSVARSLIDPESTHAVNVGGTLNVLAAARTRGVRRVVYASSSSVYGDTPTLPKHERMPVAPLSPYAASKLAGEGYCRAYASSLGVETVSLRFFNVYGPRQDPGSEYAAVIPRFVTRMLAGEPPIVFGDGTQSRDFTFVANAVQACVLAGAADGEASGEVFNVGCGGRTTLLELIAILNDVLGTDLRPRFDEPRPGDVHDSQADVSAAEQALEYHPVMDVRQGLTETAQWFAHPGNGGIASAAQPARLARRERS